MGLERKFRILDETLETIEEPEVETAEIMLDLTFELIWLIEE